MVGTQSVRPDLSGDWEAPEDQGHVVHLGRGVGGALGDDDDDDDDDDEDDEDDDGEDSYTLNKQSGFVTPITVEDGRFMFDIWIEKPNGAKEVAVGKGLERPLAVVTKNPFQALAVEEGYLGISEEEQAEIDRYAGLGVRRFSTGGTPYGRKAVRKTWNEKLVWCLGGS